MGLSTRFLYLKLASLICLFYFSDSLRVYEAVLTNAVEPDRSQTIRLKHAKSESADRFSLPLKAAHPGRVSSRYAQYEYTTVYAATPPASLNKFAPR